MLQLIKKIHKRKQPGHYQKGMTYAELIVVLSIFSIMSAISVSNYRIFQDKIDLKNLASDIAVRLVSAQKLASSGTLPSLSHQPPDPSVWKPTYGIYFNLIPGPNTGNKTFYSFVDVASVVQNKTFDHGPLYLCPDAECLEKINITKGNYIESIKYYIGNTSTDLTNEVHISFTRPSQTAIFHDQNGVLPVFDYLEINVGSFTGGANTSKIRVFPSGRIQLN